jgi:type 1 fimbriae regulatory protein FimB
LLSESEVATLREAMKQGRHGIRDHLIVLMLYVNGLRVFEAIGLRRAEVDLDHARLCVAVRFHRRPHSTPSAIDPAALD